MTYTVIYIYVHIVVDTATGTFELHTQVFTHSDLYATLLFTVHCISAHLLHIYMLYMCIQDYMYVQQQRFLAKSTQVFCENEVQIATETYSNQAGEEKKKLESHRLKLDKEIKESVSCAPTKDFNLQH